MQPELLFLDNIPRIALAKAAFRKNSTLFTSKLDLNFRKKLINCCIWSIAFYGVETWTLRKVDQTYLESFEMWRWRIMDKISWTDSVTNDKVFFRSKGKRNIQNTIEIGVCVVFSAGGYVNNTYTNTRYAATSLINKTTHSQF